jgi:phage anti-repressor protein
MEPFNIINLIEKNSITILNKTYENVLVQKIQETFSTKEQQIFLTSFFAYINYNSKKDFIIDFDSVWKWVGFSRKSDGKRVLEKHFTFDLDYIVLRQSPQNSSNGGRASEKIMLTVNTFKKFCLKSNTKKADEIHDYYIKLEELLQETIMEQTDELHIQLEQKKVLEEKLLNNQRELEDKLLQEQTDLIKAKKSLLKIQTKFTHRHKLDEKPCVYILENPDDKFAKYKIGMTKDINERLRADRTMIPLIKARLIMYTEHYEIFEKIIKIKYADLLETQSHEWIFYNLNKLIDGFNEINKVCGFNGVLEEELWKLNFEEPTMLNNKPLKPARVKYLPEALQPEKDEKPCLLPTRLLRYDYDNKNKEAPENMRFCNGFCQDYKHLNDFNKQSAYYLQKCKKCINLENLAYEKIEKGELTLEQVIKDINCVILKEDEKMCKNCKNIHKKDRFEGNRNVCKTCRNKQCAHRLNEFDKNIEEEEKLLDSIEDYDELVSYLDKYTKRPLEKMLQYLKIGRKYNDNKQDVKNKILNYYFN